MTFEKALIYFDDSDGIRWVVELDGSQLMAALGLCKDLNELKVFLDALGKWKTTLLVPNKRLT